MRHWNFVGLSTAAWELHPIFNHCLCLVRGRRDAKRSLCLVLNGYFGLSFWGAQLDCRYSKVEFGQSNSLSLSRTWWGNEFVSPRSIRHWETSLCYLLLLRRFFCQKLSMSCESATATVPMKWCYLVFNGYCRECNLIVETPRLNLAERLSQVQTNWSRTWGDSEFASPLSTRQGKTSFCYLLLLKR